MRPDPTGLVNTDLKTRTTTVCLCWLVNRQDGVSMGFTDCDFPLAFGGVTYEASSSFVGSAIEDQLGLAVSNLDVMGALSSDALTDDDIEAGRYDGATVTIMLVNYLNTARRMTLRKGTLGQLQVGDLAFQAELRSAAQAFTQYIGSLCGPKCRSQFGDTGSGLEGGCNFSLPAPVDGVIAGFTNRTTFQVFAAGTYPDGTKGTLAGGYFAYGTVKALTGPNAGVSVEISTSDESLNIVTMEPFPFDLDVYDQVQLQIGCDKTPEVCRINYDNLDNNRSEPYVPGSDVVFRVNGE